MSEFHQSSPGDHLLRDHLLTPPAQNQPLEADPKPVTTETVPSPSMSGDARESSERQYDGDFENQQLTCEFCDKVFSVCIPDTIRTSGFVNFRTIDPNLRAKFIKKNQRSSSFRQSCLVKDIGSACILYMVGRPT